MESLGFPQNNTPIIIHSVNTVNPGLALVLFGAGVLVVALLFWPRRGVIAHILRIARLTERVLMEDALKHLYNGEYSDTPGSIESLSGALGVTRARVVRILGRLEQKGLIRSSGSRLALTGDGRNYGTRILRTHRLWERYLADRTGVPAADWHEQAERREHTLSESEVEQLSASMGHPRYDPHGDPIPTAEGELPASQGIGLNELGVGQQGTIIHLEDEPREVFEQLLARKLAPLMRVQVIESEPDRIRFTADGRMCELEPVVASQVTVEPFEPVTADVEAYDHLSELEPGESAKVVQISPAVQGSQRLRLLDLGLVPGTVVTAELENAFHDPVAYLVRGALIALRREQADAIYVVRRPEEMN